MSCPRCMEASGLCKECEEFLYPAQPAAQAQPEKAIYPDSDDLFRVHARWVQSAGMFMLALTDFRAAVAKLDLRERWEVWSAKYAEIKERCEHWYKLAQERDTELAEALDNLAIANADVKRLQAEVDRLALAEQEARLHTQRKEI